MVRERLNMSRQSDRSSLSRISYSVMGNAKTQQRKELEKLEAKLQGMKSRLSQISDVNFINNLREKMSDEEALLNRLKSEH